jgi:hypothetical protein
LVNKQGKKLKFEAFDCNAFEKGTGLMFSKEETAKILAFRFKKRSYLSIHSFFVFFPFIAVWTDDKNNILCWKIVKPFRFYVPGPARGFFNLIEIPMIKKHYKVVNFFK